MFFNPMIGTGFFLSTLLIVVIFGGPVFASTSSNQTNSTQSNDISDVVSLLQSARDNAGAAS